MARPLARTARLDIRLTTEEHAALVAWAGDRPIGPLLVATALGRIGEAPRPVAAPSTPKAAALASLAAWEVSALVPMRKARDAMGLVDAAVKRLREALRDA